MSRESLESSLPVPSVQELAIQRLKKVPARYIRDDLQHITTVKSDPSICVPLIDMTKLVNPDSADTELHKLHSACKNWGVFQLINHGVSHETVRDILKTCQEFFELPSQEKKRWAQKPASLEGYGQAFVASEDQTLDWNDMIFLNTLPIEKRNLAFWPTNPQNFREALGRYSEEARQVASCVIRFLAKALGISQDLSKAFQQGSYATRFNCYPPCPEPDRVLGIMPHADISGITILLDGGDMPGLQMLKDGHWYFVDPIDGALVVNIGQIMEVMSNGVYKAPEHRAVVNKSKARLSIVTFCYPSSSVEVGPAKELTKGSPPLYKTLTIEEYWYKFYNRKLDAQFIDVLKI